MQNFSYELRSDEAGRLVRRLRHEMGSLTACGRVCLGRCRESTHLWRAGLGRHRGLLGSVRLWGERRRLVVGGVTAGFGGLGHHVCEGPE